ncbi:hypothetical protein BN1708_005367 [Verticillium longisporum]|uniref:pyruvate carboxylase n=3 Tax=Verticillium longisporum TaxID=100787 RepID=A0A0G4MA57_VERLO|nr:hypothetical protein BN1708_005367 [Verticillium longisporum]
MAQTAVTFSDVFDDSDGDAPKGQSIHHIRANSSIMQLKKILVANRGEIPIRIFRTAHELSLHTIAVFSYEDRLSMHRQKADEAYVIGKRGQYTPVGAYLAGDEIIKIAVEHGAQMIHPGYGFLSENAGFARNVEKAGLIFVGPSPDVIDSLGDKVSARKLAIAADVPVVPGTEGAVATFEEVKTFTDQYGFPIIIKAAYGGGGRGMRVVREQESLKESFERATSGALEMAQTAVTFSDVFDDSDGDVPKGQSIHHIRANSSIMQLKKILVANRGEIPIRIFRTAHELSLHTIAVFSYEDRLSMHRQKADEAYVIGKRGQYTPVGAYLAGDEIIKIAVEHGAQMIHPGYGFLSENAGFARNVEKAGLIFVGPSPDVIDSLGDKVSARKLAIAADVPVVPGTEGAVATFEEVRTFTDQYGFPIIIKAAYGGGGRGMRVVREQESLKESFERATSEAKSAFGNGTVFVERFLDKPKHIEVQLLGDNHGNIVHLYERDCSVQRRHQKVVEIAPAKDLPVETRDAILADAVKLARSVNYRNAGTAEFLVDQQNRYYFIEINPRIQVEHTITEEITGIDIVAAQIQIAAGATLDQLGLTQDRISTRGFAIHQNRAQKLLSYLGDIAVNGSRIKGQVGEPKFKGDIIQPILLNPDGSRLDTSAPATKGWRQILLDQGPKAFAKAVRDYKGCLLMDTTWRDAHQSLLATRVRTVDLLNIAHETSHALSNLYSLECWGGATFDVAMRFLYEDPWDRLRRMRKLVPNIPFQMLLRGANGVAYSSLPDNAIEQFVDQAKKCGVDIFRVFDALNDVSQIEVGVKAVHKAGGVVEAVACYSGDMLVCTFFLFVIAFFFHRVGPPLGSECLLSYSSYSQAAVPGIWSSSSVLPFTPISFPLSPLPLIFITTQAISRLVFNTPECLSFVVLPHCPSPQVFVQFLCSKLLNRKLRNPRRDNPNKKYNLQYYLDLVDKLVALDIHVLGIKDMAGVLKPHAATLLIGAIREKYPDLPIHVHTHDSAGTGVASMVACAKAGADAVDAATDSLSGMTSQPSINAILASLEGSDLDPGLNPAHVRALDTYWSQLRLLYSPFEAHIAGPDPEVYEHEIPGGQLTNMMFQAQQLGLGTQWAETKKAYEHANDLLGDIVKVTPTSKVVGDLAQFMVSNKLSPEDVKARAGELDFPGSVLEFLEGMMGQPYLGDVAVNGSRIKGQVGEPKFKGDIIQPILLNPDGSKLDTSAPATKGWRQILLDQGPKAFAKAVREYKGCLLMDTTWRDAHQSLLATRVRTVDLLNIAHETSHALSNLYSLECWGGATFDVAMRFLYEDPWDRLRRMRKLVPNIPFQMLLRGANGVAYSSLPDNAIEQFVDQAKKCGVDIFRVFDALNDVSQIEVGVKAVHKAGGVVEAVACYSGDMLVCTNPNKKYNLQYYLDLVDKLVALDIHVLGIKDMAGVLKPHAATLLVRQVTVDDNKASVENVTRPKADLSDSSQVGAPMAGVLVELRVKEGSDVKKGDPIAVLSAMKMEMVISAPHNGQVSSLQVKEGDSVDGSDLVCKIVKA